MAAGRKETPAGRCCRLRKKAFSLVEIVIALGVVSIAVFGIIGLLPVGYKIALESRTETNASFIARQIVGDLRSAPFTAACVLFSSAESRLTASVPFSLASVETHVFACDSENHVLRELDPGVYDKGTQDASVAFLARIQVVPVTAGTLSQVVVEVSAPVGAAAVNRSRYVFQTMIGRKS